MNNTIMDCKYMGIKKKQGDKGNKNGASSCGQGRTQETVNPHLKYMTVVPITLTILFIPSGFKVDCSRYCRRQN